MALPLPYEFDSSGVVKTILRLVLGLLAVVVTGIAYSLLFSRDMTAVAVLTISAILVTIFGRIVLANLAGMQGTISTELVTVRPVTLYGLRLAGASGSFAVQQFAAVRVMRASGPVDVQGGPNEMVSLVGRAGTPDILVARTQRGAGMVLGRDLATTLGLPYHEQQSPY